MTKTHMATLTTARMQFPVDHPQFSVALCTYNGARFLSAQLDSILAQTLQPAEIVVRDDGSTDQTLEILKAYQAKTAGSLRFRILPSYGNLGVAGNFMTCARACTAEYINFADQDDIWHPDRLEKFAQAFQTYPDAVAILSDGRIVDDTLKPTGQSLWLSHYFYPQEQNWIQQGKAEKVLSRHVFVTGSALAVRRNWFDCVPHPTPEFYHDEWLGWFAGSNLRLLPEATYDYRQHTAQQTGIHTTLKAKWEHLKQSQRHSRELLERDVNRFPELSVELGKAGLPIRSSIVRNKLDFILWRLNLPRNFLLRLIKVSYKFLAGDYHRFAIAHRSVIKDLFVHFPE